MAITYEEALSTLTAMFGEPWTKETLDQVLRHHEGHMENTVESVLGHGDGDPAALTQQLKFSKPNGGSNNTSNSVDAATEDVSMDEQFARQLEDEERRNSQRNQEQTRMKNYQSAAPIRQQQTAPITLATSKGRGTPTELPSDFLRVPGSAANGSSSSSGTAMDEDEKLARMLQDELFIEELARNPQFAHLTTGTTGRVKRPTNSPAFVTNGDGRPLGQQGRQVIDKIGGACVIPILLHCSGVKL